MSKSFLVSLGGYYARSKASWQLSSAKAKPQVFYCNVHSDFNIADVPRVVTEINGNNSVYSN